MTRSGLLERGTDSKHIVEHDIVDCLVDLMNDK